MTDPKTPDWTIKVTDEGPRSNVGTKEILIHPPGSAFQIGAFSSAGKLVMLDDTRVLGHELCGHVALHEIGAHPDSRERRVTSDTHDPTVNIENMLFPGQQRGLAGSGQHRGESVARLEIHGDLLGAERDLLALDRNVTQAGHHQASDRVRLLRRQIESE